MPLWIPDPIYAVRQAFPRKRGGQPNVQPGASGPPAVTNFVDDTMTGADGTLLTAHTGEVGATWTAMPNWSGAAQILANRIRFTTEGSMLASGTPPTADYDVTINVVNIAAKSGINVWAAGRASSAGLYWINYETGATSYVNVRRYFLPAFSYVELSPYISVGAFVANAAHSVTLRMRGTAISVLFDGALVGGPYTSADFTAAGNAGCGGTVTTATTGTHIDRVQAIAA